MTNMSPHARGSVSRITVPTEPRGARPPASPDTSCAPAPARRRKGQSTATRLDSAGASGASLRSAGHMSDTSRSWLADLAFYLSDGRLDTRTHHAFYLAIEALMYTLFHRFDPLDHER